MTRRMLVAALAGFLAIPAYAAAQGSQQPPAKAAPAKAQKAKKVWTNEDLEALRDSSGSAEPSGPAPAAGTAAGGSDTAAPGKADDAAAKQAEKYRQRMQALRAELDAVDAQIKSIRDAKSSGNTTGQGLSFKEVPPGLTTENTLAQLEQKRRDIQRRMDELEDEARRAGVSPGAIR